MIEQPIPSARGARAAQRGNAAVPASSWLAELLSAHPLQAGQLWVDALARLPTDVTPEASEVIAAIVTSLESGDAAGLVALSRLAADGEARLMERLFLWTQALRDAGLALAGLHSMTAPHGSPPAVLIPEAVGVLERRLAVEVARLATCRVDRDRELAASATTAVNVIVHELRRPLTSLSGFAQLLDQGFYKADLPPDVLDAVNHIVRDTDTMTRMIASLGDIVDVEAGQPLEHREILIRDLAAAAAGEVRPQAELRRVVLLQDVAEGLRVTGEAGRLKVALVNLLSNAVKYSPEGGSVRLRATRTANLVSVSVDDDGPGFPVASTDLLFEKYYRAPDARASSMPGTGLGLFIVRLVARRHGGSVRAAVRPEGGAIFEIFLPALD